MSLRVYLVPIGIVGVLACLLASRPANHDHSSADSIQPAASPAVVMARQLPVEETVHYENESRARRAELAKVEEEKQLRASAMSKRETTRGNLQFRKHQAWSSLISTNEDQFKVLRRQAAASARGQVPCTLCDGHGRFAFCIICEENHGKCVHCGGRGKVPDNELCPACLGSGKCHACLGSGKMPCAFCDDGIIEAQRSLPPKFMPVY